jgi:tetratricopeptide (TPR) repeat protein
VAFIPLIGENGLFFPFITAKAFTFRILVEIVFALWLILVLREKGTDVADTERGIAPRVNYLTITVTVFTIITLIADLLGYNPLRSIWSNFERMEGWITIVHLWAYFMVISSVFGQANVEGSEGRRNWRRFLNVFLVAGLITAIYGLFQYFGLAEVHQSASRVDASLGNAAYMAVYMIINAFIAAYMAVIAYKHKVAGRDGALAMIYVYAIVFVLTSFILFQTATRGSILGWAGGILVASAIYAIFGRSKKEGNIEKGQSNLSRYIAGGLIVLVILVGFVIYKNKNAAWVQNNQVLNRLASISISDTKTQARGFIWPIAVKNVFSDAKTSIIGIGQENFNYYFNKDYNPLMYGQEQWFDRAHSVFLDWLVASGLLGLILYLALYVFSLVYIVKSDLSLGQKCMLIALIVAYGIHNVFVFDNQTSYVMFFTILAFISSLTTSKAYKWLGHSSERKSEDAIVVRDYIFVPIIVIGVIITFYFVNIRNIQANTRLITALRSCGAINTLSTKPFEKALSLNQTTASQEIREQLIACAGNVLSSEQVPPKIKNDFFVFAKQEIEKQIATTPNDARIYVLAGSLLNSAGDFKTALPLLEKAHELTPNKQSVHFDLATNYINTGRPQDAVDIAQRAYELAPSYDLAKVAYAVALINNKQEKKAQELFGDDESIFTDSRIISIYTKNKNYEKVIEIYKKLHAKSPEDPQTHFALAASYLRANQTWAGLKELRLISEKYTQAKSQIDPLIKQIEGGKNPFLTP